MDYDRLRGALAAVLIVAVCLTFRDYGISNDEEVQHVYGRLLLDFYASGFNDLSAFSFKNLYLYGGGFDLAVALLAPWSPFHEYETRHLLAGLIGVLGVVGTGRLARFLAGPRAGFLAAAMIALTPTWYGAMYNNTKDIPFAVGMVWITYYACRLIPTLPAARWSAVMKFGVAVGLTLGIRVGAVLGVLFLLVTLGLRFAVLAGAWSFALAGREALLSVGVLLPAGVLAYAIMAILWPWAVFSPLNPLRALETFSAFPIAIPTIVGGQVFPSDRLPSWYLAAYLLVKLPEVLLGGVLIAFGFAIRRTARWESGLTWLPVVLAAFFPLAYFVAERPTVYNGMRHFMFVVPPLAVIAAAGWDRLLSATEARCRWAGMVIGSGLLAAGVHYGSALVQLHPDQYVWFNRLAGGVRGAQGRFELDYWANSVREAVLMLNDRIRREGIPEHSYKVAVCAETISAGTYAAPFLTITRDWPASDFFISPTQMNCEKNLDGRVMFTVERAGAVLAVVKDRRPPARIGARGPQ